MKNLSGKILIVDDEEKIRSILSMVITDAGCEVETAKDGIEALKTIERFKPHVVVADLQMPQMDGIETIIRIKERYPNIIGIILTAHGTIQSAVQAIKQGVYDYITKPFDNEQLLLILKRALEVYRLNEEIEQLKTELQKRYGIDSIIGNSSEITQVKKFIQEVAATDSTVLIEGESGTGKELAAKAIHYESNRKHNPLVIVDCTAIATNLIESEFFGHERGSFTDAKEQRKGKFEEADKGTIFLDEISELPNESQSKLLRVLQEREFTRVGGNYPIKSDVRIIAATNKNLDKLVKDAKFREDLYYRINVLRLHLPSLREHIEDIPLYVKHFLPKYKDIFHKNINEVSDEALSLLRRYEWKGNIREFENVIQRAMLNTKTNRIDISDLDFLMRENVNDKINGYSDVGLECFVKGIAERTERDIIINTLKQVHWNQTKAAEILKISRKTMYNKIKQYNIFQEVGNDSDAKW